MMEGNTEAAEPGGRTHCPVCQWEIEASAAKCPFCGSDFAEVWQRHGRVHRVANTAFAVLKLSYVPAIYWAITAALYSSWEQARLLYSRDPHLALTHWFGALHLPHVYVATSWLFLFVLALGWIIQFWPDDVNPAGSLVNGFCTWVLFFPLPVVVLLIVRPGVAARIGEMVRVTVRYLLL